MDVVSSKELIYSEAFKVLDELVDTNELSKDRADEAKKIYQNLHTAALKAMASEKQRLDEAKVLKKRLEDDNEAKHPPPAKGEESDLQSAVQVLKEDEEAAQAEVTLAKEKVHLLEAEVGDLTQTRNEAKEHYELLREQHRLGLLPQIQQLQEEINVTRSDIEGKQKKIEKYVSDVESLEGKLAAADECHSGLAQLKSQCDSELRKAQQLPEKAARQSRTVETLNTQLETQHRKLRAQCDASDALIAKGQEELENLETEHATTMVEVERGEYATEAQERSVGEVQKQFHLKQFEAEQILAKQAELAVQDGMKQSELLRAQEELTSVTKEKDRLVKRVKKLENVLKVVQASVPSLEAHKEQQEHNYRRAEDVVRKLQEELKEQRAQVDLHMMLYLQEEGSGKEKNALFVASHEHIVELERSIGEYRKVEQASLRALHDASAARDRASMQQAIQVKKLKECKKDGMLKEMIGRDLKKMRRSIMSRVRDFQQLYDLVKNQRNRFVNLIQAARQGICEMKEKLRITLNELEILRTESAKKEKLLSQRRSDKQRVVSKTMALRAKLNKLGVVMRERQNKVDEQIAEIDKHNAIINTTEKEMLRLRKQYEVIVELRNYTGVMVIDRNDELCVMYERKSVQETVQRQGDYALSKLEDQIRVLKIDVTDVSRSIEATKKKCPEIPKLDENIATLQRDILMTKQEGRELELHLEDPSNTKRWRMLHGRVKDKDELRIKVNQLEERLNYKKEQLLERDLILEEVTNLSNALRLQAMAGRAGTLAIARKSNAYQAQLRTTTRKMMATISELSMYQATVMKLSAEKEEVTEEVHRARLKLADGEAPTEEADKQWKSIMRGEEVAEIMHEQAAERMRILEARGNVQTTTAEPRPRAYIPEDLGIPKPYGNFEPFKPAEPGATMRHIRKPEIQPVVI